MSVIKAMRGESSMQFIETARRLELHAFSVCTKAPKRYAPLLTNRIFELASTVHKEVRAANNIYPHNQHEAQMRRGHSFKVRQRTNQYFKSLYGFYPDEKGWKSHV